LLDIIGCPIGSGLSLYRPKDLDAVRGMVFRRNVERERLVYSYWIQGHTIDEISRLTGIPRSSVGYYVRKFNKKYGRRSRVKVSFSPALGDSTNVKKDEYSLAVSGIMKSAALTSTFETVVNLVRQGRLQDAYYCLGIIKLFNEIKRIYSLTPEEQEVAEKAIDEFLQIIRASAETGDQVESKDRVAPRVYPAVKEYILEERGGLKELRESRPNK